MPKVLLTNAIVTNAICPTGLNKQDLFDTRTRGLHLEVRKSGGKTFYLRYRDKGKNNRQMKIASASDISLSQARVLVEQARNRMAMGVNLIDAVPEMHKTPTFYEFVTQKYLPFVKGYKRSYITDESLIRNHLIPAFGGRRLDEITKADIVAMHHGRRVNGGAASSANRLLILTRYIFNMAIKWETHGVIKNPAAGLMAFKENNKIQRYLTKDETFKLLAVLPESKNAMIKYIIPALIISGCRKREVLDAKWDDMDFNNRIWRIPISKSGNARFVPITDGLYKLLIKVPRHKYCPYVFPNPTTQKPYTCIYGVWNKIRRLAKLPNLRIHDLRHTFASYLVNNGRSLYEVQQLLGHSNIKTTQRYAHLSNITLQEAASVASTVLGSALVGIV